MGLVVLCNRAHRACVKACAALLTHRGVDEIFTVFGLNRFASACAMAASASNAFHRVYFICHFIFLFVRVRVRVRGRIGFFYLLLFNKLNTY